MKRYQEREIDIRGDYVRQMDTIKQLEKDKEWVIAQGKKGTFSDDTFKEEVTKAEQKLTLAKMELTEMHAEEMDVGALLAYAYNFIRTVEITWLDAPFESKIKLQRLIFPLGVEYTNGQFSNPKLSPLFKLIEVFGTENVSLVTQRVMVRNQVIPELIQYYSLFAQQVQRLQAQPYHTPLGN